MTAKTQFKIDVQFKKKMLAKADAVRAFDPELAEGYEDIAHGRVISQEELFKKLGL